MITLRKLRPFLLTALAISLPLSAHADFKTRRDAGFSEQPGQLVGWGVIGGSKNPIDLTEDIPKGRAGDGFIQISGSSTTWGALKADGEILIVRGEQPNMREVDGKVVKISVQGGMTVALDDLGKGYIWAKDSSIAVPPSAPLEDLVDIETGYGQGYALTASGDLIWWGNEDRIGPEFSDAIAPFQGEIAVISADGFGGSFLTRSGTIVQWGNYDKLDLKIAKEQPVAFDRPGMDCFGGRVGFLNQSGGLGHFGGNPLTTERTGIDRIVITEISLAISHADSGWEIHDDGKFTDIGAFRTFLQETPVKALVCLGYMKSWEPAEKRTLGAIAIVPGSSTLPAVTSTASPAQEPAPAMPVPPAPIELPSDHGITDPRFTAYLKLYEAELQAKVQSAHNTGLAALNTKLDGALERGEKAAIGDGDLDRVTAFRAERALLETGELPVADSASKRPMIQRYRTAWHAERTKLDAQRALDATPIRETFEKKLAELETTLTKEEKIDEALKVRAFRRKLTPVAAP